MPRYEFSEGSSNKFWEIELNGLSWTTRWGRIGTVGQSKTQTFETAELARHEYDRLVVTKVKKGYRLVGGSPRPVAAPKKAAPLAPLQVTTVRLEADREWLELTLDGDVVRQVSGSNSTKRKSSQERHPSVADARDMHARLISVYTRRGYVEVSRSVEARDPDDQPGGARTLSIDDPAQEAACLAAAPDDSTPWSVYADFLQSRGDKRGELAALLTSSPATADAFAAKHALALWVDPELDPSMGRVTELTHRFGFYRGATLRLDGDEDSLALDDLTRRFLEQPITRFVTSLRFGLAHFESNNDWGPTITAIAKSTRATELRELAFNAYTSEDCELSWTPFGDFSKAWGKLTGLESLHLRSGKGGTLGTINLPRLKRFIRESGGLGADELHSIMKANWPELEWLELWTGSSDFGAQATLEHFVPLLEGKGPPKLRRLGVVNSELGPSLLGLIAQSKLLKQLKVLDFSKGVLCDREVSVLIRYAESFRHLELFDLSANLFEHRLDELQRALPNARLDAQRDFEGDDDDDDEPYRYVAVGE